jgi:hypothetical protein
MDWLHGFLGSEAGIALQALVVAAILDFLTGTFAALRDGTFEWQALGAWIRKHLMGRVSMIGVGLLAAYYTGNAAMMTAAILAATAYGAETAASLIDNFGTIRNPERAPDTTNMAVVEENGNVAGELVIDVRNPVPQD